METNINIGDHDSRKDNLSLANILIKLDAIIPINAAIINITSSDL
jgi:hypothetical protein